MHKLGLVCGRLDDARRVQESGAVGSGVELHRHRSSIHTLGWFGRFEAIRGPGKASLLGGPWGCLDGGLLYCSLYSGMTTGDVVVTANALFILRRERRSCRLKP